MSFTLINNSVLKIGNDAQALQDISSQSRTITITTGRNEIEANVINFDTDIIEPGNKTWNISIELDVLVGDGNIEQILFDLFNGTAKSDFEFLADGASISTSNPKWSGTVSWTGFPDFGGAAGQPIRGTLTGTANSVLVRATS